jgi:hypothetical protein
MREDSSIIAENEEWSESVPRWMITASRIATGSRRRVLENGPDTMRSSDEDALEYVKPDEEHNMYT